MPMACRFILNTFFYLVYSFIGMLLLGILYWKILDYLWKPIPLNWNIVYMKIAIAISFIVLIITIIFRKYFYISTPEVKK